MSMTEGNLQIVSFTGKEVGNYEFRRTRERLSDKNIKIKSYQLHTTRTKNSNQELSFLLRALETEVVEIFSSFYGLWFARMWQSDTAVCRKIGARKFLSDGFKDSCQFTNSGVLERDDKILHWGNVVINQSNFGEFADEISYFENGALFACNKSKWPTMRDACINAANQGEVKMNNTISHFEMVKCALYRRIPIVTITNWIEDSIVDFDLFVQES